MARAQLGSVPKPCDASSHIIVLRSSAGDW